MTPEPSCLETAVHRPHPLSDRASPLRPPRALALSLGLAMLLAACGPRSGGDEPAAAASAADSASAAAANASATAAAAAAAAASAPPVSVTLVRALPRDFTLTLDASGTVTALSSVDVKPQVSAQVLQVHVKEGQTVQRGQPLFTLDARVDQANLKKAEAQLLKDEATLADARRQLARNQDLLAKNFISQGALDTSMANVEAQQAVVAADRAAIDAVKVQLSYSRITAPGAGRVGQILVFPGSSVSPTGAALLTITQTDPVAVAFSLPQRHLPDALKALASGRGRVTAVLPDSGLASPAGAASAPRAAATTAVAAASAARGAAAPAGVRVGQLDFVDSVVDPSSGTVKVKARFANPDQALWPGAYVTVKMALMTLPDAIVVPQAAIVQGARGTAVFVADKDGKAAIRPVKILAAANTEAVVSGLKPGERVVLDGRQNVRPGVTLIERTPEGTRGAGGPGRAASGAAAGAADAATAGAAASAGGRAP